MSLDAIITGAVAVQRTLTGITVYDNAPEALNDHLPAVVIYPEEGDVEWPREPSKRTITHSLTMDFFASRGGDLAGADRLLKPYVNQVIALFDQNITLQGSCLNAGIVKYKYGKLDYAGVEYLGIKFTLRAVELTQLVYKG